MYVKIESWACFLKKKKKWTIFKNAYKSVFNGIFQILFYFNFKILKNRFLILSKINPNILHTLFFENIVNNLRAFLLKKNKPILTVKLFLRKTVCDKYLIVYNLISCSVTASPVFFYKNVCWIHKELLV